MQGALLLDKGKTNEGQALINSAKKKGLSLDEINEIIWPGSGKPPPPRPTLAPVQELGPPLPPVEAALAQSHRRKYQEVLRSSLASQDAVQPRLPSRGHGKDTKGYRSLA
jgi:hypothetical protein